MLIMKRGSRLLPTRRGLIVCMQAWASKVIIVVVGLGEMLGWIGFLYFMETFKGFSPKQFWSAKKSISLKALLSASVAACR
jgi:hypothetical protein